MGKGEERDKAGVERRAIKNPSLLPGKKAEGW
jgi:hypothetical protein